MQNYYLPVLVILALPILWAAATWFEAYTFKRRLYGLGHLVGRSKDEIILAIGAPSSFSVIGPDKDLLQWQRWGYHIALVFSAGVCEGVTHEHKSA